MAYEALQRAAGYELQLGSLSGKILQTRSPLDLQWRNGGLHLDVGTKYLDLHFQPSGWASLMQTTREQQNTILAEGATDYLRFLTEWPSHPYLKDVELIIGCTNRNMANFALRQLGFHYIDHGYFKVTNPLVRGFYTTFVGDFTILGQRDELYEKFPRVVRTMKRLQRARQL